MEKWNMSRDGTQREDEKIEIVCLVMFTPGFIVFRLSKMSLFVYFLLMTTKNQSRFGQNFLVHLKGSLFSSFRKCYGLLGSMLPLARYQPFKILNFSILLSIQQFFNGFLKELKKIFQVILPKLWLFLCCFQQKIRNMCHFWHFKDHNFGSKHDK